MDELIERLQRAQAMAGTKNYGDTLAMQQIINNCFRALGEAIEALQATQWVETSERLPELAQNVVVDGGIGYLGLEGVWYSETGAGYGLPIQWEVTHWMPLPSPPNKEK